MEFVAEVIHALRGTEAKVWCLCKLACTPHLAAVSTGNTTYFYWFGIYTEIVLAPINLLGYPLANFLAQIGSLLLAVIELATGYEVGHLLMEVIQLVLKQSVLTVYPF